MIDHDQMAEIVSPFTTVSDKIRALARHDVPRAEIARFLGKRYQHVRNVLEGDKSAAPAEGFYTAPRVETPGLSDQTSPFEPARPAERIGRVYRFMVDASGTIKLPEEVMAKLQIQPLSIAVALFENDTFAFLSREEALRRARALVPQWRPGDPLWSDELIAERRREAAEEERDV